MGMSVTVSEIDVPRRARSPTGSSKARASASRSRTSCVRSFVAWAMIRRMVGARGSSGGRPPLCPLVHLNDGEEDVLQRVVLLGDLEDADRLALETSGELACRGRGIALDDDVEAVAEERHAPGLHLGLEDAGGARRLPRTDLEDAAALGGLHAARRAMGSTPEVGSSRKRTRGSCIIAAPKATRCFQPPGRLPVIWPPRSSRPAKARTHRFRSSRRSAATP